MFKRSTVFVSTLISLITANNNAYAQHARAHHFTTATTQHLVLCNERRCSELSKLAPRMATTRIKFAARSKQQVTAATRVRIAATRIQVASPTRVNASSTRIRVADANGNIVGGRPAGCPYAFCGCEASRFVFGEIRPELNLAMNWIRKFPRTSPAPYMVAARNHHVMVLLSQVDGYQWLVHDGNSGHHLTREHVVSIKGFVIVDPHAARTARAN
jgi:hypothetical protein